MGEIAKLDGKGGVVAYVPPDERGTRIAALDAAAKHGAKIRDESAVTAAISEKLAQMAEASRDYQRRFQHGGDRKSERKSSEMVVSLDSKSYCRALGWGEHTIRKWAKLQDPDEFDARVKRDVDAAMKRYVREGDPFAKKWTGETEWYTPAQYIESARTVMGGIDLDPASCESANAVVKADAYHDESSNGLKQPWAGRVWMNPPYKMPSVKQFCERLIEHVASGAVPEAIVLTNNATDTSWWVALTSNAAAVCFTTGRISFYNSDGASSAPTNGQNFHYFGANKQRFVDTFAAHGMVMVRA